MTDLKLKSKSRNDIRRVRFDLRLAELEQERAELNWGPSVDSLPQWTRKQFDDAIAAGRQLIIMDFIVHDLEGFYDEHPGGDAILRTKVGKDATIAFNGGVQRHSKAARNLADFMRIARIYPEDIKHIEQVVEG